MEFQKAHPNVSLHYVPAGSSEGIRQISSGRADFGASDAPMSDKQMQEATVPVMHFPSVLGAAVPTYNLSEVKETLHFKYGM